MPLTREQALPYVSYAVDDAGGARFTGSFPDNARLVGWQCGFEPMFVAVFSYLPDTWLDNDEAETLAQDWLEEIGWFGDSGPVPADYII